MTVFQTAVTLAEFGVKDTKEVAQLKKEHLQDVIKMSKAFEEYLLETHNADESELAKVRGQRADDFDEETVGRVVAKTLSELGKKASLRRS